MRNKSKLTEIQRTLFEIWDPLGIRDIGGPKDEYDSYAEKILYKFDKFIENCEEIRLFLNDIAEKEMELSLKDIELRCQLAANELYEVLKN